MRPPGYEPSAARSYVVETWMGGTTSKYGGATWPMPCAASASGCCVGCSSVMITMLHGPYPIVERSRQPAAPVPHWHGVPTVPISRILREDTVRHTDYYVFPALWTAWAVCWFVMARN